MSDSEYYKYFFSKKFTSDLKRESDKLELAIKENVKDMKTPLLENLAIDLLLERNTYLEVYSCIFEDGYRSYTYIGQKGIEKDEYVIVPKNAYREFPAIAKVTGTTNLDLSISRCYKFLVGTVNGGKYDFTAEKEEYETILNKLKNEKNRIEKEEHYIKAGFTLEEARKITGLKD